MNEEGSDGDHGAAGQDCPAVLADPPSAGYGGQGGPGEIDPPLLGFGAASVLEEEKSAIRRFLDGTGPQQSTARARMVVWALRIAATLLLVAGVATAVGDGNEYDGVDCGVAAKPPKNCPSGRQPSERVPEGPGGRPPGSDGPPSPGSVGATSPPLGAGCWATGACSVLAGLPAHCFGILADHLAVGPRAVVKAVEAAMQRFEGKLDAIASGNLELLKENGELRALQRDGFFKFALRVDPEDFRAFAAIMALGNRKLAAEALEVTVRSFYERVERWNLRGADYQRMAGLIGWRKRVGRKIRVRLEDSVQSGEPNDDAENPVTVGAVLASIATADTQDYPAILRQVMETLEAQNPGNWARVRQELVEMIKEEVGQ